MKKLRLKRISMLANKFGNYCYVVLSGNTEGISGITIKDGVKMLWSFARLGAIHTPFNAQLTERKVGDKTFLNLVDDTADAVGSVAYMAQLAKRAGIGEGAVDMEAAKLLFAGLNTKQPNTQSQAVAVEQPVEEVSAATTPVAGAGVTEGEEEKTDAAE